MVRLTFGEKGERLKWNFYFLGIFLIIVLATCHVLIRLDWSAVQRSAFEKHLLEIEEEILVQPLPTTSKVRKLMAKCNQLLRNRWMAGYLYDKGSGAYYFVGRASGSFRKAVEAQKALIDAGKPFDKEKVPNLRIVFEFEKLHCRFLAAEIERPNTSSR